MAERKGCAPSQLALAWVMAKGKELGVAVIPIPGARADSCQQRLVCCFLSVTRPPPPPPRRPFSGTKSVERLEENIGALRVATLGAEEMAELEAAVPAGAVAGARY